MLLEHFKLSVQPFGVTPDARFLYLSPTHREALASLFYGVQSKRGFTALIAAPGMGKTTLIFHLLGLLKGTAKTAFLFQTFCNPQEFLRALLGDLGIEDAGDDPVLMQAKLNDYLLQMSKEGRQVVVVIDEAQNLDGQILELVRMLSNFETPGDKLMHLLLSGQPQLADRLSSEPFTQLRQRISIVARLAPFTAEETRECIEHRLRIAGAPLDKPIFSKTALAAIAEQSGGVPRNINNLCFNAMSLACALKKDQVDASMVREVVEDLDLTTIPKPKIPRASSRLSDALSFLQCVPILSSAFKPRWAVVIVFLIFLDMLLAYPLVPSHTQIMAPPAAAAVPDDSDANPVVHDLPSTQTGSPAPISSVSISRHRHPLLNRHANLSSTPHSDSGKGTSGNDIIVRPGAVSTSVDQIPEKAQEVVDKSVPLEPAPQRDKP